MSVEGRLATSEDLDEIVDIFFSCWQESYRDLLPAEVRREMTVEKARELWLPSIDPSSDRLTLLVLLDDVIAGVARCGSDPMFPERGHLFSLYIHPKYARKGLGKALLTKVLEELKAKEFTEFSLWVFKENESAKVLYTKSGFLPSGIERVDERWKIPEIEMLKNGTNLQN